MMKLTQNINFWNRQTAEAHGHLADQRSFCYIISGSIIVILIHCGPGSSLFGLKSIRRAASGSFQGRWQQFGYVIGHLSRLQSNAVIIEMHVVTMIFRMVAGQRVQVVHVDPGALDNSQR